LSDLESMLASMSWKPGVVATQLTPTRPTQSPLFIPPIHLLSSRGQLDVAKAMKCLDVETAQLANGCTWKQGKGDHIKW
jgi:hypothetical protein